MDKTIVLGKTEYTIKARPIGPTNRWRKKFVEPVKDILLSLADYDTLQSVMTKEMIDDQGRPTRNLGAIIDIARPAVLTLLDSPDLVLEAVLAWDPELAEARDQIEEEAFLEQLVDAFIAILGHVYPLGALGGIMGRITGTTSSSPPLNGAGTRSELPAQTH